MKLEISTSGLPDISSGLGCADSCQGPGRRPSELRRAQREQGLQVSGLQAVYTVGSR